MSANIFDPGQMDLCEGCSFHFAMRFGFTEPPYDICSIAERLSGDRLVMDSSDCVRMVDLRAQDPSVI